MHPDFRSWESPDRSSRYYYEPGQIETLWVLDIDGTVVVINASLWPESSAADRAEFADVLDSIRIDPDDRCPTRPRPTDRARRPGTYYVDEVDGTPTPRIFATLDSGWYDLDARPGWEHIAKGARA